MAIPAWKFYRWSAGVTTDLTEHVKIQDVNISIAGGPMGTSYTLPLIGLVPQDPTDEAKVPQLGQLIYISRWSDKTNSATAQIKAVGIVTGVSRNDNYSVAGTSPLYEITVSDGIERFKQRIFKQHTAPEAKDPKNADARAQEWPKWYRVNKDKAAKYGKKNPKTPQQMLEWVVAAINRTSNGQTKPVLAGVVTPVPQLTIPVKSATDPSGYTTAPIKFNQNYPAVLDGRPYFAGIDDVCKVAGLNWRLEPYLAPSGEPQVKIRTWPAYYAAQPISVYDYSADIEIADSPGVTAIDSTNEVVMARSISGSEDKDSMINYVVYTWEPVDGKGAPKGTRVGVLTDNGGVNDYLFPPILYGTPTASSSSSTHPPFDAFDREDSTYWLQSGTTTAAWVAWDYVTAMKITAYDIKQSGATSYKLQSSTDNSSWTDRATLTATETSGTLASPITARYWRLLRVTGSGSWRVDRFNLKAPALSSVGTFGRHDQLMPTSHLTKAKAKAEAVRLILQNRRPDFRGNASIRYRANFDPGTYIYLHRALHSDTKNQPYWVRFCQVIGVSYGFSDGGADPTWMDLEFGDSVYNPPRRPLAPKDWRNPVQKGSDSQRDTLRNPGKSLPGINDPYAPPGRTPPNMPQPIDDINEPDDDVPLLGTPYALTMETVPFKRNWSAYPPNEAINGSGTASAIDSNVSYPPTNAFDNDNSTYWQQSTTTTAAWIKFDFGAAKTITGYKVSQAGATNFSLQHSSDNTNWTNAVTGLNSAYVDGNITAISRRYWRLLRVTGSGSFRVYKFELFGNGEKEEIGSFNNRHRGRVWDSTGTLVEEQWERVGVATGGTNDWVDYPVMQFRDTVVNPATGTTYNACSTPIIIGFAANGWNSSYGSSFNSLRIHLSFRNRYSTDARKASKVRLRQLATLPASNFNFVTQTGTSEYSAWYNQSGGNTPIAKAHWKALMGNDDKMQSASGYVREFALDEEDLITRVSFDAVPRLYTITNQQTGATSQLLGAFFAAAIVDTFAPPAIPASASDTSNYAEVIVGDDTNLIKVFTTTGGATVAAFGSSSGGSTIPPGSSPIIYPQKYIGASIFPSTAPTVRATDGSMYPLEINRNNTAQLIRSGTYTAGFTMTDGPSFTGDECYAIAQFGGATSLQDANNEVFKLKLSPTYAGQTYWEFAPTSGTLLPLDPSSDFSVYIENASDRRDISRLVEFTSSDGLGYRAINISPYRLGGLRAGEQLVILYAPLTEDPE